MEKIMLLIQIGNRVGLCFMVWLMIMKYVCKWKEQVMAFVFAMLAIKE